MIERFKNKKRSRGPADAVPVPPRERLRYRKQRKTAYAIAQGIHPLIDGSGGTGRRVMNPELVRGGDLPHQNAGL